jgi:hypothetical protein
VHMNGLQLCHMHMMDASLVPLRLSMEGFFLLKSDRIAIAHASKLKSNSNAVRQMYQLSAHRIPVPVSEINILKSEHFRPIRSFQTCPESDSPIQPIARK